MNSVVMPRTRILPGFKDVDCRVKPGNDEFGSDGG
jgi:hypothetical protein